MWISRAVLGALGATLLATSANAALLYSNDFQNAATVGAGVVVVGAGTGNDVTAGGPWNAAGWANAFHHNQGTAFTTFSFSNLALSWASIRESSQFAEPGSSLLPGSPRRW